MIKKRSTLLFGNTLITLCFMGLVKTPSFALEFQTVIQELATNYPPLEQARLKRKITEGKLLEKQSAFDTELKSKNVLTPLGYYENIQLDTSITQPTPLWGTTFFSGYRLGNGSFADYDGKKETLSLGEWRGGLEVPLLKNGAIDPSRAEIQALQMQLQIVDLDIFEKRLKFTQKALETYWDWLAAHHQKRVAQKVLNLALLRNEQLKAQIELGKKPPIDRVENQRAVLKRQNKMIELSQKERSAAYKLSLYLKNQRIPTDREAIEFPPGPAQCALEATPMIQRALSRRPERLINRIQIQQNQLGTQLAENQRLPNLDLFLVLSQDFGEGSKTKQPFEAQTGLQFKWPLQMRKARGQLQQLQAENQQLKLNDQFLKAQIKREVQAALLKRNMACKQMSLAENEVKLSTQLALGEKARFDLGATSLYIVNKREQDLADAQLKNIGSIQAFYQAESQLALVQGLLPGKTGQD